MSNLQTARISRSQKLAADCQIRRHTAGFGNPAGANCDLLRIVELSLNNKITLPAEVAQRVRPADRFLVWPQGDMVIFKRITVPRVTEIVPMTPETQPPLSMEEIDAIVHEARKQRARE